MLVSLRAWAKNLKQDVIALWLAARDPRVPRLAKFLAGAVAAYALSPIDLIPDFIPVLGLLDDLLIVPLGIWLAVRLVEPGLMTELRSKAAGMMVTRSWRAAIVVVLLWLAALGAVALLLSRAG
ncbi:YkvA family protein [Sphingobium sp. DEHP117]|uniref:YkvA family protein n=1 Tax=Sphingobium sp. DEHP117 TaxID=2993436 RepID=UPI0027D6057F|nr:DUF1232 domain-containing protein [Sphingobium sp. DEHP117]MDQ4421648.1 YkvA family protein [Sphingobium sp. DEHP117]